jgi:ATP-dependent helicase/nuclease subunit A
MIQDQLLASDPLRSVWVSASAGTGKTKVLTDRVLRLLLQGEKPGGILCITYTKAAAAEMLERIEHQLGIWAITGENPLREILGKLTGGEVKPAMLKRARELFALVLDAPEKMRVQTIHSFCQSVIARFPLEAGVSPHMSIIDEYDSTLMLKEACSRLFRDANHNVKTSVVLHSLAKQLAESTLQELLKNIIGDRRKFVPLLELPGGDGNLTVLLHEALSILPCTNTASLTKQYFTYTPQQLAELKKAIALLSAEGGTYNLITANALALWLEQQNDVQAYADSYLTDKGKLRATICTKKFAEKYSGSADLLNKEGARALQFSDTQKTLRAIASTQQMLHLAGVVLGYYHEEKNKRGMLDFDDLIQLTVKLFKQSNAAAWVLYKLDSGINHLLVDEAQDTSTEQWQIVAALVEEFFTGVTARVRNRTLFVVGDEKQSIFSFQGANPQLFEQMRLALSKKAKAADKLFSHVRLDVSFRSTQAVLEAVDTVFALDAARDGVAFSETHITHKAFRAGKMGRVEIWPLIVSEKKEKQAIWDKLQQDEFTPSSEQLIAKAIADEIAGWLKNRRMLSSQGRPVEPGDIMILVRRRGTFAEAMVRHLKRVGVPVAGADRLLITDHIAVMDCLALADFLLLPKDDLTLAALLKSPFIGITEDELFTLCYDRKGESLWQRVLSSPKHRQAADFLREMLSVTDFMPPFELFTHALSTLGKRCEFAKRLGREADDPLNEFLNLALHYERNQAPSLQGFLQWIRSNETHIKRDMEKGRNEVRVLTIHASKGLQAPIIFMPDTTSIPKRTNPLHWLQAKILLPLWVPSSDDDDTHLDALKQQGKAEMQKEYRRLLYVAMTRAEDELYICGWKSEKAIPGDCWYELIRSAIKDKPQWREEAGRIILQTGQENALESKPYEKAGEAMPVPDWANAIARNEPVPSKPLSPSRLGEQVFTQNPDVVAAARARGVLIHRLLQHLPQQKPEDRRRIMQRFVDFYAEQLTTKEREDIIIQVTRILEHPELAAAFSEQSLAEVPVAGVIEDESGKKITIAGQIDRLAILDDSLLVIDFKTSHAVPANSNLIPEAYRQQMQAYRKLLQKIYPGKTVRCAIVWTATAQWMELQENKAA